MFKFLPGISETDSVVLFVVDVHSFINTAKAVLYCLPALLASHRMTELGSQIILSDTSQPAQSAHIVIAHSVLMNMRYRFYYDIQSGLTSWFISCYLIQFQEEVVHEAHLHFLYLLPQIFRVHLCEIVRVCIFRQHYASHVEPIVKQLGNLCDRGMDSSFVVIIDQGDILRQVMEFLHLCLVKSRATLAENVPDSILKEGNNIELPLNEVDFIVSGYLLTSLIHAEEHCSLLED